MALNAPSLDTQDIYAIPSITPPHPLLHSPTSLYQSISLLVVNRAAGLSSGLGILYALASSGPDQHGHSTLAPHRDPGFFLGREAAFNPAGAVLLGWVEEERLGWLDGVVARSRVPRLESGAGQGLVGCTREWLLELLGTLEMEGVLSNPELLVAHFFRPT